MPLSHVISTFIILLLDKEWMLVFLFLHRLHRVEHYDSFETAKVNRELLMRQLYLPDDSFYLLHGHLLAHSSETRRQVWNCEHIYILVVEVLVERMQQRVIFVQGKQLGQVDGCGEELCIEYGFASCHIDLVNDALHVIVGIVCLARVVRSVEYLIRLKLAGVVGV